MTQPPCKNCADRTVGCHGICMQYNDWAIKHKVELKAEKKLMPPVIRTSSFTGTSPKPGHARKTKRKKR